jgi:predicted aconitase with swiveling domain
MAERIAGVVIAPGRADGIALVTDVPLSFWGGYDASSGEIIDRRHPLSGQIAAGRVLVLPATRGSSTTTAVLLEAIRNGAAPAAILTPKLDPFLALACIVADELFGAAIPLLTIPDAAMAALRTGQRLAIDAGGGISVDALDSGGDLQYQ